MIDVRRLIHVSLGASPGTAAVERSELPNRGWTKARTAFVTCVAAGVVLYAILYAVVEYSSFAFACESRRSLALAEPYALWDAALAARVDPPPAAWLYAFHEERGNASAAATRMIVAVDDCFRRVQVCKPGLRSRNELWVAWVVRSPLPTLWRIATAPYFWRMPPLRQLQTLMHECTHLALGTDDVAYGHEVSFNALPPVDAMRNADSVVSYMIIATRLGFI